MKRKYGWKRDRGGSHPLLALPSQGKSFPPVFSLRGKMPPVYDQGQTMSCTGNATAAVLHYGRLLDGCQDDWMPSRKFPYYNGRLREGWQGSDQGAMICDVIDSLADQGYCREELCPFDDMDSTPADAAYDEGKKNLVSGRAKLVQTESALKSALMDGRPIICGMSVYSAFESEAMRMNPVLYPPTGTEAFLGGHAIVIVGWKDGLWEVRNSWGASWGDEGHFWAAKEYFVRSDLSSDFTVILKS